MYTSLKPHHRFKHCALFSVGRHFTPEDFITLLFYQTFQRLRSLGQWELCLFSTSEDYKYKFLDKNLRQNISFKHQKGAVANLLLIVLIIVKYWIGHTTPPFHDIWTVRSKVICFGMPCWHILSTGRGTHPHLLLILTFVFTPSDIEKDIFVW